jgi:hypothetical protein
MKIEISKVLRRVLSAQRWLPSEKDKNFKLDTVKVNSSVAKGLSMFIKKGTLETVGADLFLVQKSVVSKSSQRNVLHEIGLIKSLGNDKWELQFTIAFSENKWHGLTCYTISKVWRDKSVASGTPKYVLYKYLIPQSDIVMGDSMESEDMEDFWIRQYRRAFGAGFELYIVNLEEDKVLHIDSSAALGIVLKDKRPWGNDAAFRNIRFAVSKKLLDFAEPLDLGEFSRGH